MKMLELGIFILASTAVCLGCLVPARWLPPLRNDKWMHFGAFSGLALLARFIAKTQLELMIWFLSLLLAGLLIEVLQIWVPGRSFCWRDMAANTAGVALIALLSFLN
jgi:VanZ family protein